MHGQGAASNAVIVQVGPAFFIKSGLPGSHLARTELILPEGLRSVQGFLPKGSRGSIDILSGPGLGGDEVFALVVSPEFELPRSDGEALARDALSHMWAGLVHLGLVTGEMPEVVVGDPSMLYQST